jgi:hypothetical protein
MMSTAGQSYTVGVTATAAYHESSPIKMDCSPVRRVPTGPSGNHLGPHQSKLVSFAGNYFLAGPGPGNMSQIIRSPTSLYYYMCRTR